MRMPYLHGNDINGGGLKGIMCSHLDNFLCGGMLDVEGGERDGM